MAAEQASQIDRAGQRTDFAGMLSKLTRIVLALFTAIVLTGQMEAAAQHCARLAEQAQAVAAPANEAAPACHESQAAAADVHAAKTHAPTHSPAPDHCECVVAPTVCAEIAGATSSRHAEPYAWLLPGTAQFASNETDPDLRPPRA